MKNIKQEDKNKLMNIIHGFNDKQMDDLLEFLKILLDNKTNKEKENEPNANKQ